MNPTPIVTHVPVYVLAMEMVTRQVQTVTLRLFIFMLRALILGLIISSLLTQRDVPEL